ncbi:metallophosphoesterase [Serinibacter arcticus]|uniref:metallophosphoesterase n=1 Tax=Serinibacter arcticus TaxID=1655435 RepID=UPI000D655EBF|nr:metallophosphoesterase [Serinibacter arcticus]
MSAPAARRRQTPDHPRTARGTRVGALGAAAAVAVTLGVTAPGAPPATAAPIATTGATTSAVAQAESGSRFTLAVLPDTQFYSRYSADQFVPRYGTDPFQVQTEWLVENAAELNIPFVVHVGDVVDRENQAQEWTAASRAMGVLEDGGLGYSILPGNHDVVDQGARSSVGNSPRYLSNFATSRVSANPGFVDSFQNGLGTAYTFEAQGETFMSLALPWNADQSVYAWAQGVLDAHPDVPVVLSSHAIIGVQSDQITPADFWFGQELWDRLIAGNDQIFLTLNGHFHGATQRTRINDAGNEVYQILTDYQMAAHGGNGYLSLIEMDFASGSLDVETVSPWITKKLPEDVTRDDSPYLTGQWQSFSLPVDFADRFAGFAPDFAPTDDDLGNLSQRAREIVSQGWEGAPPEAIEAPGAREDHVAVEGTVAHWRFGDQAEGPVPENGTITDAVGASPMHRLPWTRRTPPTSSATSPSRAATCTPSPPTARRSASPTPRAWPDAPPTS